MGSPAKATAEAQGDVLAERVARAAAVVARQGGSRAQDMVCRLLIAALSTSPDRLFAGVRDGCTAAQLREDERCAAPPLDLEEAEP